VRKSFSLCGRRGTRTCTYMPRVAREGRVFHTPFRIYLAPGENTRARRGWGGRLHTKFTQGTRGALYAKRRASRRHIAGYGR
jgi:hypothetical protein